MEYDFSGNAKVGNEGVITVEEAKGLQTELDVVEGMQFDRGFLSPYFITNSDKMTAELENPLIFLRKKLSNLQTLVPLLESVVQAGRPLLIIAEEVEGEALATLVVTNLEVVLWLGLKLRDLVMRKSMLKYCYPNWWNCDF